MDLIGLVRLDKPLPFDFYVFAPNFRVFSRLCLVIKLISQCYILKVSCENWWNVFYDVMVKIMDFDSMTNF